MAKIDYVQRYHARKDGHDYNYYVVFYASGSTRHGWRCNLPETAKRFMDTAKVTDRDGDESVLIYTHDDKVLQALGYSK